MTIDLYCQQRNCSPLNALFSDVQIALIWQVVPQLRGVKQKQVFVHTWLLCAYLSLPYLTLWRPLLQYDIFLTSGHSDAQPWASECPDVKHYKWWLNPVWHRMLYSCTRMATVGVKGLIAGTVFFLKSLVCQVVTVCQSVVYGVVFTDVIDSVAGAAALQRPTPPPYVCSASQTHIMCLCCTKPMPDRRRDHAMPSQSCEWPVICDWCWNQLIWEQCRNSTISEFA